jgi:hypothetical protein
VEDIVSGCEADAVVTGEAAMDTIIVVVHQKNKFSVGDKLNIMAFDGENITATVISIEDEYHIKQESAPHPKQKLFVTLSCKQPQKVKKGMILRSVEGIA